MLFDEVRARQADGQEVSVSATYVQIYREQVPRGTNRPFIQRSPITARAQRKPESPLF